ncbi:MULTISPECIES: sugar O-acetyltransferase [unclassified Corallococcus]|uniref:sugar O-acetyltransferase n=1 Tax=unclassified Corallococcus TaxID=2685029 RepID=UPI001A8CBA7E|nr:MULTISPECIES: sugar O-acetyltransferase [unclassified Corallococcus]MBN9684552.1 sugar O-acetyltransferase [Corallococcus sp. NCSPR001]WAS83976.1 sugar O-acetyltransferase [Corallococcus sp. NCRR]
MARTEKEKMLAGELYSAVDPRLVAERARARKLLRSYNQSTEEELPLRESLLTELLGRVGAGTWIEPPFFCDYGEHIRLGERVFMNFQCVILDCNTVTIGDDVSFGPNVQVYAATHPLDPDERIKGPELGRAITIGSKVWIGGGSIICPGVTIGEGTTIGAGSVVTRDIPPYVFAAGNPCRVIRSLR